jgi:hypothetical protein
MTGKIAKASTKLSVQLKLTHINLNEIFNAFHDFVVKESKKFEM